MDIKEAVAFCRENHNAVLTTLKKAGCYGPWVQIAGPAEIVSLPAAMPLLEDYYRDISGEHPDWDDYRAAMEKDQRCIIRITPTEVGPNTGG